MLKANRVFSKLLHFSAETTAIDPIETLAADIWTVEEDITVIGCEVMCGGMYDVDVTVADMLAPASSVEISQTGKLNADGILLKAWKRPVAFTDTGTVRAPFDWASIHAVEHMMFPAGYGAPVKEDGSIYLHCEYWPGGVHKMLWSFIGIVYYVKGA